MDSDTDVPFERSREDQAWARWLGRGLDNTLMLPFVLAGFVLIGFGVQMGRLPPEVLTWFDNPVASTAMAIVLSLVISALWEPLFLSNIGTTPGKWLMGVHVRRPDGQNIGGFTALWRLIWVWVVGMGAGIPLVTLITALFARAKLIGDGATAWDEALKIEVTHKKRHPIVWFLVIVFVLGVNLALQILNRMPA